MRLSGKPWYLMCVTGLALSVLVKGMSLSANDSIGAPMPVQPVKVIMDSDFFHFADDHEALLMLNTLQSRGYVELLGISLVTGNHWMGQMTVDTLKAVERIDGLRDVPVYQGALGPLVHNQELFRLDKERYGSIYAGAWTRDPTNITAPPDGYAGSKGLQQQHAVDFIIDTVRANPAEVTLLALGPLTNIALAFSKAPDIVPLVGEILYMGGNVHALGNVTAAAEFNFWFDAEAAAIVLRQPIKHTIVPLDATDRILFDAGKYKKWAHESHKDHTFTKVFMRPKFSEQFADEPAYVIPVWDALVPAVLVYGDRVIKTERDFRVAVDHNEGAHYGRLLAYPLADALGATKAEATQRARVILELHEAVFWKIYEDLVFDGVNDIQETTTHQK